MCEDIGRQMLTYGRRIPLQEIEYRLDVCIVIAYRHAVIRGVHPTPSAPTMYCID